MGQRPIALSLPGKYCWITLEIRLQRKVSAGKARSIILLTPEGMPPDAADARMIRIILAIKVERVS
jgi:hypothetical protein